MPTEGKKLFIVSNRLPVVIAEEEGQWTIHHSSGGLVTALSPLMKRNHGIWLGWPGCDPSAPIEDLLKQHSNEQGYQLRHVNVSDDEIKKYYRGFSNRTIWPLFHDLLGYASFDLDNWNHYRKVNERFATEIARLARPDHFIWIHDYQLLLVGSCLRHMNMQETLNFFLHIPFPSADLFRRMPWRKQILEGMLDYDHIGFQTQRDRRNFVDCVRSLVTDAEINERDQQSLLRIGDRTVKLGTYPISIDFDEFNTYAQSQEIAESAWYIHEQLNKRKLLLGLDRLDYTKGIPERFLAYARALEKYPDLQKNVSLVQIVVPSRLKVPEYRGLKEELDTLVGKVNSEFSREGWIPVHYMFRHLNRNQLLGYYRACEIAFITPLRDGMNLVSKEYCASSVENNGVLILSEFAGAAEQFAKGALMVNPYDLEGTADAIYQAYTMPDDQRQSRMQLLRDEVRTHNVHRWVRWFLEEQTIAEDEEKPVFS